MSQQQYIEIFTKYRDVIDKHASPVLNARRDEALNDFQRLGFPTKKMENYKHIDVEAEFIPDYALNLSRVPMAGNPYFAFSCKVPNLNTNLYYILNDLFNKKYLPEMVYPEGVYVGSLKDFANTHPDICEKYYGKLADTKKDAIAAFNTMFVQDGLVVYVPKKTVVETPIQLINILKSDFDYLINRRILIIAEENAQVKLLSCDHTGDGRKYLVTQVNEIYIGANAIVDFYDLEENSDNVTRFTSTFIQQSTQSNVLFNSIALKGGITRNNYNVELVGEHAETYVCGLVVGDQKRYVDNFVYIDHAVSNCVSTQLFKYILLEEAIGAFCGRIYVAKDAQKTLAYQSNNNLCVSSESKMYSKPQLEIYADDVKCSHGLTTGQLDDDALFYLRARGLSENTAKFMLMHAFATDVLNHVRLDVLKDKLSNLVEKRLKGENVRCGDGDTPGHCRCNKC